MEHCASESEKFITASVIDFINQHIHSAHLSTLDEIILNYVVTVLESLAKETRTHHDSFDVEEFCEMLAAYFPGFESIPHDMVTKWIFDLVSNIRKGTEKGEPKNELLAFESFLSDIDANETMTRSKQNSESSSDSSGTNSFGKPTSSRASRSPKVSETSDTGDVDSDVRYIINRLQSCQFQCDDNIQTLLEMFPSIQKVDAQHFLATTNGDLEKAVQLVLAQLENNGEEQIKLSKRSQGSGNSARCAAHGKVDSMEEKVLKDRIVARYGFIDQAEDKKEFRPPPLKSEPKKLVRYRESQVVSTKGERYSEVKCGADGGEIKNYIYKPPKPY